MDTLFNEAEADAEVAKNLAKHKKLIEEIKKMRLFKEEGQIFIINQFEAVTREELQARVDRKQAHLDKALEDLSEYDTIANEAEVEVTEVEITEEIVEVAPVDAPAPTPVEPEEPTVPAENPPAQPEQPVSETPVTETPAPITVQ